MNHILLFVLCRNSTEGGRPRRCACGRGFFGRRQLQRHSHRWRLCGESHLGRGHGRGMWSILSIFLSLIYTYAALSRTFFFHLCATARCQRREIKVDQKGKLRAMQICVIIFSRVRHIWNSGFCGLPRRFGTTKDICTYAEFMK